MQKYLFGNCFKLDTILEADKYNNKQKQRGSLPLSSLYSINQKHKK